MTDINVGMSTNNILKPEEIVQVLGVSTFANMSRCKHIYKHRVDFRDLYPIGSHMVQCSDCGYFWLYEKDIPKR